MCRRIILCAASMMPGKPDQTKTLPNGNPKLKNGTYDNSGKSLNDLRGVLLYGCAIYKCQSYLVGHNSEKDFRPYLLLRRWVGVKAHQQVLAIEMLAQLAQVCSCNG